MNPYFIHLQSINIVTHNIPILQKCNKLANQYLQTILQFCSNAIEQLYTKYHNFAKNAKIVIAIGTYLFK